MAEAPKQIIVFFLTQSDLRMEEEITLAGVLTGKISKGDYKQWPIEYEVDNDRD